MPIAAMSKFPSKPKNIPGTSVRLTPVQLAPGLTSRRFPRDGQLL